MARKTLFISHAEKDTKLAGAMVELLKNATSIKSEDVISFSLEEAGIPSEEDFVSHIRSKIGNPESTIVLLTPNYLSSRFCLCELGTVWAISQNMIPLLVPPLEARHVTKLIPENRLHQIDDPDDLNKFIAIIQEQLGLGDLNLPRWAMEKKKFTNVVKSISS